MTPLSVPWRGEKVSSIYVTRTVFDNDQIYRAVSARAQRFRRDPAIAEIKKLSTLVRGLCWYDIHVRMAILFISLKL